MQLLILAICAVALFLTWLLYREIQRQNRPRISTTLVAHKPAKPTGKASDRNFSFRLKPTAGKLQHRPVTQGQASRAAGRSHAKLVKLLNGDRSAAQRLVQSLMLKHPDRSEEWCYEKAVFDLERDRG
ncbi:hypothetical protein ACQ4M4_01725 [Leptolyngbya sp. AN02str]|uniref:hypothetical protein n=1 Tax=Leptolyngbya sp. AN02str TaxID=3423363 RepID=UPI003D31294D